MCSTFSSETVGAAETVVSLSPAADSDARALQRLHPNRAPDPSGFDARADTSRSPVDFGPRAGRVPASGTLRTVVGPERLQAIEKNNVPCHLCGPGAVSKTASIRRDPTSVQRPGESAGDPATG
ncbi:Hypothetical protein CINCED_3A017125 [Cinara cedri]|uniref:Uncharacterized protein n=1 Tax=Cinara cedri TaxID=506608 RepID=A0A5E4M1D8_9HEMI|nr:Hypothetical protein CINCED_3A017125 [Cinara cedri]